MKTLINFALFCLFSLGCLISTYQSWGLVLTAIPLVVWFQTPLNFFHKKRLAAVLFWLVFIYFHWLLGIATALTYFAKYVWSLHRQYELPMTQPTKTKRTIINPSTGLPMKDKHFDIAGNGYFWDDD
ncbi:hypothetical protein [Vibrio vulnificus]|uniref:hypothetical protein n=1 Tax=Vibrio vulnificus TaxID=672 RepID=UPI0019D4903A|nr:hypothetical protein [Vibrio vulnificus]EFA1207046.1 hypothetical protein [Escherichia coli]EJE4209917.1 hypothetical protein [Vibrio parahaemolyticus]EJL6955954.1 hypothetical protein [Vibrio cholerae]EJG1992352.1 hypothetical protein [Vibrio parahaemolyticus]MBN8104570.1 hypothetical protein [Vibrio vulnificus]